MNVYGESGDKLDWKGGDFSMPGTGTGQGGKGGKGASAAAKNDDEDLLSIVFGKKSRKKKSKDSAYDVLFPKSPVPFRPADYD